MPANGASRKPGPQSSDDDAQRIGGQDAPDQDDELAGTAKIRIPAPAKKSASTTAKTGASRTGRTASSTRDGRPGTAKKAGSSSATRRTQPTPQRGTSRPGQTRKPGRSIAAKQQKPWGLIIVSVLVVVFAAAVIGFAVTRHAKVKTDANNRYDLPEVVAAKTIKGLVFKPEQSASHVTGTVKYDTTPPTGGNHNGNWADCSGTVYPNAIANENAVHDLEHGAVWITYKPGLPAAQVATLASLVTGQDHTLMSPYPGQTSAVSLQAWGYQLKVASATDPRIKAFIAALRDNPASTPEVSDGQPLSCTNAAFKKAPSTFGHPVS